MKYVLLTILAGALSCTGCARKDTPATSPTTFDVAAALSTNTIHIGDEITLRVTATVPANHRIEWPDLSANPALIVREHSATGGVATYRITTFEVGDHVLSSNDVVCVGADGTKQSKPFPFLTLSVVSLLDGTNATPRDLKPLAHWPDRSRWILPAVLALIALLALLMGLFMRGRKGALPARPIAPPIPPHDVALAALKALRERGYAESGQIALFYTELSQIVRTYIEARFGLKAPEQTTEEFIREATSSRLLSLDHQLLVSEFLEQCDLVKFARHQPSLQDMSAALAAAERLVRETIPQPAIVEVKP